MKNLLNSDQNKFMMDYAPIKDSVSLVFTNEIEFVGHDLLAKLKYWVKQGALLDNILNWHDGNLKGKIDLKRIDGQKFDLSKKNDFFKYLQVLNLTSIGYAQATKMRGCYQNKKFVDQLIAHVEKKLLDLENYRMVGNLKLTDLNGMAKLVTEASKSPGNTVAQVVKSMEQKDTSKTTKERINFKVLESEKGAEINTTIAISASADCYKTVEAVEIELLNYFISKHMTKIDQSQLQIFAEMYERSQKKVKK